jgi:putative membrane protein
MNDELAEIAANDELANDRTFLAWLRTALASIGLGVVVAKVAFIVNEGHQPIHGQALYSAVGISFVVCGAGLVLVGFFQHRRVERSLDTTARPRWLLAITLLAVAGAGAVSVLLGISA